MAPSLSLGSRYLAALLLVKSIGIVVTRLFMALDLDYVSHYYFSDIFEVQYNADSMKFAEP